MESKLFDDIQRKMRHYVDALDCRTCNAMWKTPRFSCAHLISENNVLLRMCAGSSQMQTPKMPIKYSENAKKTRLAVKSEETSAQHGQ